MANEFEILSEQAKEMGRVTSEKSSDIDRESLIFFLSLSTGYAESALREMTNEKLIDLDIRTNNKSL